jgi:hypothetical protein
MCELLKGKCFEALKPVKIKGINYDMEEMINLGNGMLVVPAYLASIRHLQGGC